MTKIRYDYEYLQKFCQDNGIELLEDYSDVKVNRDTIIHAKCLTNNCNQIIEKSFRSINKTAGCYCLNCTHLNSNKKLFNYNYLEQYCKETKIKLLKDYKNEKVNRNSIIEAKCLTQECENIVNKDFRSIIEFGGCYCVNCCIDNSNVKRKKTCLEQYGYEFALQVPEVKDKIKNTNLEKYGSETPLENVSIKEKAKKTMIDKYGFEYTFQSNTLFDKFKNTMNQKYGCNYSFESLDLTTKTRTTMIDKYGHLHPAQVPEIQEKIKSTNLEKYGTDNPFKNVAIKEKAEQTILQKYGSKNAMHNSEIADKASKNAYKSYEYIFPSGRIERIQGYENLMLDELLQKENILEHDIILKRSEVPECWYEDANKNKHRYYVDCFIKSQNRCIEAKSTWTAEKKKDNIFLKQNALKNAGYKCEIWVYNSKGEKVECYI